jgi:hypothetical protein
VAQHHYNIIRTLEQAPLFFHMAGIKHITQSWSSSHHVGAHIALFYQILAHVKTQQEESWRLGVSTTRSDGKKYTRQTTTNPISPIGRNLYIHERGIICIPVVVVAAAALLLFTKLWLVAGECVKRRVSVPQNVSKIFSLVRTRFRVCFWKKNGKTPAVVPSLLLYSALLHAVDTSRLIGKAHDHFRISPTSMLTH